MKAILGIQEAHDASAALMIDGSIVAAAQEERFSGLKGDYGFPEQAVRSCLKTAGIGPGQIDRVGLASHNWNPVLTKIKRNANFSVDDWVLEQQAFWKPLLFEGKRVNYYDLYKDRPEFQYDQAYPMDDVLNGYMDKNEMEEMSRIRKTAVSGILGIPDERIETVTHEDCHTFYAYFGSHLRGETLALTAEGIGDYSNGTVSIFSEKGRRQLVSTRENHIGHIYQYITLILGMKPAQHEYKVMGLAPYANSKELEKSFQVFRDVLKVDGLNICFDRKPEDLYFHFRDALEGHRFDGIAGAVQRFTETLLCGWVQNCIAETGLKRIVFSGGVAQNIKANKCIMEMEKVDDISVCPAAGDTSLSIGACYHLMFRDIISNGARIDDIHPLHSVYLGPEYTDEEISEVLDRTGARNGYQITRETSPEEIAGFLADGRILGRCSGRMEFGLRALGNRSILADPRRSDIVRKINDAIKFRDFWMPFTPTILSECQHDYIINPKGVRSPFMTMAFESTSKARKDLAAALHPADFTIRPQILEEEINPEYHALIKAFENQTGVGGVLNTSFNLHGEPIVLGPEEAMHTLERSGLDGLILGGYLLRKF